MKPLRLGVVGATGLVGRTTLEMLAEWQVPLQPLRLFASDESGSRELPYGERQLPVERLTAVPADLDVAIFATSRQVSRRWIPEFRKAGIVVIDHSAEFRMDADVPLAIPEINGAEIARHRGLLANPNCSASIVALPLAALDRAIGLRRVVVDTYQSVSGSGQDALAELETQLADPTAPPRVYPRTIGLNVFPQIGSIDEDGHCDEERKIVEELRKILNKPALAVFTTTVRVPVRVGHSAAVTTECDVVAPLPEIEQFMRGMPGMICEGGNYRTPLEIAGRQEVYVGRMRQDSDDPRVLQFWVTGDNLRKGAASNAVQILQELIKCDSRFA